MKDMICAGIGAVLGGVGLDNGSLLFADNPEFTPAVSVTLEDGMFYACSGTVKNKVVMRSNLSSAALGVVAAVAMGILVGLFFALFVVKLKSDEFVGTHVLWLREKAYICGGFSN